MSTPPSPTQSHITDPYVVLGVPRNASRRQLAEAYRRLAKRHHPDVDPDPAAAERMRRINAAWRTLSDLGIRAQHAARANSSVHWTSASTTARRAANRPSGSWAARGPRAGGYDRFSARRAVTPPPVRRPTRPRRRVQSDVRFQDTGLAALLAAAVLVLLLLAAAYAGSVSSITLTA